MYHGLQITASVMTPASGVRCLTFVQTCLSRPRSLRRNYILSLLSSRTGPRRRVTEILNRVPRPGAKGVDVLALVTSPTKRSGASLSASKTLNVSSVLLNLHLRSDRRSIDRGSECDILIIFVACKYSGITKCCAKVQILE